MRTFFFLLFLLATSPAWCQITQDSLTKYVTVKLTADMSSLSDDQRRMIPLLIDAADQMDDCFWYQAYGSREDLFAEFPPIASPRLAKLVQQHVRINYGPWERLQGNRPFLGNQEKPPGANFYPRDMTKTEFEEAAEANPSLKELYTFVRRSASGELQAVPYNVVFKKQFSIAADKLRAAARLADDEGFRDYLISRADALTSNQYQPSDMLWMDMKKKYD